MQAKMTKRMKMDAIADPMLVRPPIMDIPWLNTELTAEPPAPEPAFA